MIYGIILAAGSGSRMKIKQKKQFLFINNKPVIEYSIDKFLSINKINKTIIVINESDKNNKTIKTLLKKYNNYISKDKLCFVVGGKERYNSVFNAISFIDKCYGIKTNDKVLIHDSARPNVDVNDIKILINYLNKYKALTLGSRLTDTIKKIKFNRNKLFEVIETVNRDEYFLIKTPQGFNLKLLYDSYNKFMNSSKKLKITDDLQIIEYFSKAKTYILDSSQLNYKITTKNDLNVLKYIM